MSVQALNQLKPGQGGKIVKVGGKGAIHRRIWMWFSVVGQLVLAWVMAFVVFQGGKLLGLG